MKKIKLLDILCSLYPDLERKELFSEVMCGKVKINGETIRDPKRMVSSDVKPEIARKKYVSRGGYKLEKVLRFWEIDINGKGFLDAGASTGGFTDCLLQNGASFVHAVDVGYNQLDYSLRVDDRVFVHEKTNIMHLDFLDPPPSGAVADLSFRSINDAASKILSLTTERYLIALVKPQFEIRQPDDSFDGILRDSEEILRVAMEVLYRLREENCFVTRVDLSPVKGKKGNQELLFYITDKETISVEDIQDKLESLLKMC
ncbi:TlyA family RNA methyltransferase [Spirochaeta isovalerica]|uniref:23S rRNA (Cytidine1920-2'-O)/16S rRNA (Cytidine1409-2'-O)-methyltransferase n=1 Tax=Spirochaeta isovalerica TaxID=150 RepID=A0A841RA36_9SPIO|nr:TlyA family RNA methyltransferase [Spirochaeta isovalerica]MBB6482234.1 23S rRNA (cytidine1920-2'-O)/16S rRNA (cytidine1409-2'-O)-methyltransferase [Spirochaeta isovalerica]